MWVIAETTDLPTKFAKIVTTDDAGRYVIPDMPKAKYKVWVRGYGLVDPNRVDGEPGKNLNLTAKIAPTPVAAAKYYPGKYWYSMLKICRGPIPGNGYGSGGQWHPGLPRRSRVTGSIRSRILASLATGWAPRTCARRM